MQISFKPGRNFRLLFWLIEGRINAGTWCGNLSQKIARYGNFYLKQKYFIPFYNLKYTYSISLVKILIKV